VPPGSGAGSPPTSSPATPPTAPATSPRAPWPELEPWPEPRRDRPAPVPPRRSGGVGAYLGGIAIGAVLGPLVVGGLWMVFLFYADRLAGFDTGNNRLSDIVVGSVLAAPFLGMIAGALVVRVRRRRASDRAAARNRSPGRGSPPARGGRRRG